MDKVTAGLEGVRKIVNHDDILIQARSLTLSIPKKIACAFLDRCRQHGNMVISPRNSLNYGALPPSSVKESIVPMVD